MQEKIYIDLNRQTIQFNVSVPSEHMRELNVDKQEVEEITHKQIQSYINNKIFQILNNESEEVL